MIFVYSKILTVLMGNLNVLQGMGGMGGGGVKAVIAVYSKILTVVMDTLKCFTGDGRSGCDICVPQDRDSGDGHFKTVVSQIVKAGVCSSTSVS